MSVVEVMKRECPRCGGDVYIIDNIDYEIGHVYIGICPRCGEGTEICASHASAVSHWYVRKDEVIDEMTSS